jgi:hypothetical protein
MIRPRPFSQVIAASAPTVRDTLARPQTIDWSASAPDEQRAQADRPGLILGTPVASICSRLKWGHHTVRQAMPARSNGCKSRPGKAQRAAKWPGCCGASAAGVLGSHLGI